MNGAREYAELFSSGVYGRLYIISSEHARGKVFHIYVMPEGATAHSEEDVEVYGVIGGYPGWTEWYGWLHEGPWQADFLALVDRQKASLDSKHAKALQEQQHKSEIERNRQLKLLSTYKKET